MPGTVGVDVGGTFTDFLAVEEGRLRVYKRLSTPHDPAEAVVQGLREMGATPDEVVHGSTVATNTVLERSGARTALITTQGFRDVLEIGRQARANLYGLAPRRTPPLVERALRLEVAERVAADGAVLQPLLPAEVARVVAEVEGLQVDSVAVCLLFSFLFPEHERLIADALRAKGISATASHEVLPEYREYERASTTVLNAYLAPVVARYLTRLEEALAQAGVRRLRIMQSDGTSLGPAATAKRAVRTVLSGPAGGVAGAFAVAKEAGFDQVITFDMGGTSTDVSLCPGRILERFELEVSGLPLRVPSVDVNTVGAGGGSIAGLDAGGALRVGPESARADPGPACYGVGTLPTVTDAQVVLGRLQPGHFLGGRMPLYPDRARQALEGLGGDAVRNAAAVVRVANVNMERAIRVVSVERGYDPRGFTLVAFGGAGPLHACDLAESLGIARALVPRYPGVLSALGMAAADSSRDYLRPFMGRLEAGDSERASEAMEQINALLAEAEAQGRAELLSEGLPEATLRGERWLTMRYVGQSYELPVGVVGGQAGTVVEAFHALHERTYGHADRQRPVEVVSVRARVIAPGVQLHVAPRPPPEEPLNSALVGHSRSWFDQWQDTPIYDRERLGPGHRFPGPAIIVQMDSTTVVPPGWTATVLPSETMLLEHGNL